MLAQHARNILAYFLMKNFYDRINAKILKANKGIGIIRRLSNMLPRNSLLIIYKSFIRPHLNFCDIIYDQPNNESFCTKMECIQCNGALAITGAIKGTSHTKLYKKLGFEDGSDDSAPFLKLKQVVYQNIFST